MKRTQHTRMKKLTLTDSVNFLDSASQQSWLEKHQAGFTSCCAHVFSLEQTPPAKVRICCLPVLLPASALRDPGDTPSGNGEAFLCPMNTGSWDSPPTLCSYSDSRYQELREKEGQCRKWAWRTTVLGRFPFSHTRWSRSTLALLSEHMCSLTTSHLRAQHYGPSQPHLLTGLPCEPSKYCLLLPLYLLQSISDLGN